MQAYVITAHRFFSRRLKTNASNETTTIVLETTNSSVRASIPIILKAMETQ